MKYELDGTGLFADGRTILFPGGNRDVEALAELVRRANAYDGLLEAITSIHWMLHESGRLVVDGRDHADETEAHLAKLISECAEGGAK